MTCHDKGGSQRVSVVTISELKVPIENMVLCESMATLIRAPVAVSATFAMVGAEGGGVKTTSPPNSKTKRNRKARENAFDCSQ